MGGIKGLLLLLWVGVTVGTVVDLQKRIIGGQPCNQNKRQYHVKITDKNNNFICGGSLISDRWILTAAHCKESTMNAVVGVHPGPGQSVRIRATPVIFRDSRRRSHDIMLLKLPNPEINILPVQLPDCENLENRPKIGDVVQIAGHGATAAGPNNKRVSGEAAHLQCANIDVVDCQRLRNIFRNNYPDDYQTIIYQHWFCGQTRGVDTCPGDSGGGVVNSHGIYGVHSFTGNRNAACTEAAGFMDVCAYIQWIRTTIAKPKKCLMCG